MNDTKQPVMAKGLEGVIAASSGLSNVEGTVGRLSYRGYSIDELAENSTFEEVTYLLWHGELPDADQLKRFKSDLVANRVLTEAEEKVLRALPLGGAPIDALRTVVSVVGLEDEDVDNTAVEAVIDKATKLTAKMPIIVAGYHRLRNGQELVASRADLDHSANFLYMLNGEEPDHDFAHAFDTYLILAAEHSLNASTFAAMVTISALSDYNSSIVTAIGTLRGAAHGGANQKAMEMLIEIGSPENVESFVDHALATKRRLMGMGHRIYKVRDPRAKHLARYSDILSQKVKDPRWFEIATTLDKLSAAHPYFAQRGIYPNVEFYSAPLLYSLGLTPDLMPAAFAISRISGWTGHLLEQLRDNRIFRPSAEYTGPEMRHYTEVGNR